jgi:hypothetical protein
MTITPTVIGQDEASGVITLEIDLNDLPEGTTAIRTADGQVIDITGMEGTVRLQVSRESVNQDGAIEIVMLGEEDTPLGEFQVAVLDKQGQVLAPRANNIASILLWVGIGIGAVSLITLGIALVSRKKKRQDENPS